MQRGSYRDRARFIAYLRRWDPTLSEDELWLALDAAYAGTRPPPLARRARYRRRLLGSARLARAIERTGER